MRRALAAAVLGLSFWVGSLAWTGFVLTRTVLDPGRSQDVAEALYDDEAVRSRLAANIAGAIEATLPPDVAVPRPVLDDVAVRVLDSPAVEAVVVDALVRTHAAFLGEGEPPEAVEAGAFGAAARAAIVEDRPELDAVLPAAPELRIPLPTEHVPDFGPVRDAVAAAVPVLAGVAGAGAVLALIVTSDRPAVMRRAGFWAIGLSAAVLAFAYGIPAFADRFAPEQAEVVAALVAALAAATKGPALALAGVGGAGVAVSLLWRPLWAGARSSADVTEPGLTGVPELDPAGPTGPSPSTPWTRRRDVPTPHRRPAAAPVPSPRAAPVPAAPPADGHRAANPTTPVGRAHPPGRRWVDGVGWVLEAAEPIPPDARWVPGVGYVVDR